MTTALVGGEGTVSRPCRSLPSVKTRYPLYRRLVGPQDRSGQVRKTSSLPGFDPRTVQPIASRYTDYATRPTTDNVGEKETALFWAIMLRVAQQRAFIIYFAAEARKHAAYNTVCVMRLSHGFFCKELIIIIIIIHLRRFYRFTVDCRLYPSAVPCSPVHKRIL
jgi:hypothetical protein